MQPVVDKKQAIVDSVSYGFIVFLSGTAVLKLIKDGQKFEIL